MHMSGVVISLCALAIAALHSATRALGAQESDSSTYVYGTVTDSLDAPLAGAEILLLPSRTGRILSDGRGEFNLVDLPPGPQLILVRKLGYSPRVVPLQLERLVPYKVAIQLFPLAQQLSEVVVSERSGFGSVKMSGFEQRKAMRMGQFIDRKAIEKRDPIQLSDMMLMVPGVTIGFDDSGNRVVNGRPYGFRNYNGQCAMAIFVDGVRLPGVPLDRIAFPKEVEGIEVYNSAGTIPPQFRSNGSVCGVILVWTRSR